MDWTLVTQSYQRTYGQYMPYFSRSLKSMSVDGNISFSLQNGHLVFL